MTSPRDPDEEAFEAAVRRLVPGYLSKREKDLVTLRHAYHEGALALVRDIGHRLAGSGSSYGFEGLTALGRALEEAAEQEDRAAIGPLIAALERELQEARRRAPQGPPAGP